MSTLTDPSRSCVGEHISTLPLLSLKGVEKFIGQGATQVHVLKNICLSIMPGEFVAIIGQSGSGKSSLINVIGCLDVPSSGAYMVQGLNTCKMDPDQLAHLRCNVFGFIFQHYNLLGHLNALENVALPAIYAGVAVEKRLCRATEILSELQLTDKLQSKPHELSGGQQQRVSIARALINGGRLILADEPTGALDSQSGNIVMDILRRLHSRGHTIIVVTHDKNVAAHAERIIELHDGAILSERRNDPQKTIINPEHSCATEARPQNVRRVDQLAESLRMALQSMRGHKLRSLLTMLGIIIGIASVVTVVALGRGSQKRIMTDINAMGTNTIDIFPGKSFGDLQAWRVKTLTVADADILGRQSYIAAATPNSTNVAVLTYNNISFNAAINGVSHQFLTVKGMFMAEGRFFTKDEVNATASVVVIDHLAKKMLFPHGEKAIGKIILFNRQPLEIIGVTKKNESIFAANENITVWSPHTTVMYRIFGIHEINSITLKIKNGVTTQVAEQNITRLLTMRHSGTKDFYTFNTDSISKTIKKTTDNMKFLISGVALISLIVGGVGVLNIMLVSVTERKSEIGLRMAIGARRRDILAQFLIEAVLLCVIGGGAGLALAFGIGVSLSRFVDFTMSYSSVSVLLALSCSTVVGIVFGFMPARNASRLSPINALTRE